MSSSSKPPSLIDDSVFYFAYGIFFFAYFAFPQIGATRFLPMMVPVSVGIYAAWSFIRRRERIRFNKLGVSLCVSYAAVLFGSYIISGAQYIDAFVFRKFFLTETSLLVSIFAYRFNEKRFRIFAVLVFLLAITYGRQGSGDFSLNVFSTNSGLESVYGIAFGAITVWMLAERRYLYSFLSLVACLLLFKRNAIGGAAFVGFVTMFVYVAVPARMQKIALRMAAFFTGVLCFILTFYLPTLFGLRASSLSGVTAEQLSTGRTRIYDLILYHIGNSDVLTKLFGHGPGAVERLITSTSYFFDGPKLAHNEYFSLTYDFGVVGASIVFFMLWRMSRVSKASAATIMFLFSIFIIENVFFMTMVLSIVMFLISSTSTRNFEDKSGN